MARSVLGSFVSGTRQILAAQLIISVGAVGLAGWTLGVTNDLIRERERLNERVIQLEATLAQNNIVVPSTVTIVDPPPRDRADAYPPPAPPVDTPPPRSESANAGAQAEAEETRGQQADPPPDTPPATPAPTTPPAAEGQRGFNPALILELFLPPPPMRTVVLHARSEADAAAANQVAAELMRVGNVQVSVVVMPPRDARQSGYAYFDGRQSRAAANIMQQFHDIARRQQIAAWSAQLAGVALPAQGEYTVDRLDIVLPPLPAAPPRGTAVDPRRFQNPPPIVREQPQPTGPVVR